MATKKTTKTAQAIEKPSNRPTSPLIPVRQLRFISPQDGEGFSVVSSLTACHGAGSYRSHKHQVFFSPQLNQFKILFYAGPKASPSVQWIPLSRVMVWSPMTDADQGRVPFSPIAEIKAA